jgi:3-phenylpropionate/trans-cinnamate dioxygenase ferredoxin reductase component
MTSQTAGMVIVGAGHCGGRAAEQLRLQGWNGSIHLVGNEACQPYERPPLSKELLTGEKTANECALFSAQRWSELCIEHHTRTVKHLDLRAHCVWLDDGTYLPYRALLLATGGTARALQIPGGDLPGVQTLRTLNDAHCLAMRLLPDQRVLVVGGGFIGLEVAASAVSLGARVTLVEGASQLMGRVVPEALASRTLALHRDRGVDVRLQIVPIAIERYGDDLRVLLSDGTELIVDTVVVGIGITPATRLAYEAGIDVGRGILVDAQLRTSADSVFAAGDVTEFPSALSGQPIRQETWFNAETQAEVAAANMLGSARRYDRSPWFWSDQYDHQLQICGEPALGVTQMLRPLAQDDYIIFYLTAGARLVAMAAFGSVVRCAKEFKVARALVERRCVISAPQLADPGVKLKSLLRA